MTSNEGLVILDLETGSVRPYSDSDLRMLYHLTSSPDGRWFVATSRGGRRGDILFDADQELRIGTFEPAARTEKRGGPGARGRGGQE